MGFRRTGNQPFWGSSILRPQSHACSAAGMQHLVCFGSFALFGWLFRQGNHCRSALLASSRVLLHFPAKRVGNPGKKATPKRHSTMQLQQPAIPLSERPSTSVIVGGSVTSWNGIAVKPQYLMIMRE